MLNIAGYSSSREYRAERGIAFYRGRRIADDLRVLIKTTASAYPSLRETLRLRNEYEITRSLADLDGVLRPLALERYERGLALILEDTGSVTLGEYLKTREPDLNTFFRVAIPGASILAAVHRRSVIHKDLRPETIVIHPETGDLRLTNFGIASRIPREDQAVANPESLEGDLNYISPEQTGRMNRSSDFRSDFYSLGVVLYEILTGRRPFISEDPLELVHAHIAQRPMDPTEAGAPCAVARIVLKLLAKTPEERYQSAAGLLADLELCARKIEVAGHLNDLQLTPGTDDVPAMFQIPQKLYGRENETQSLLAAFDRTARDGVPRMLLVTGTSGIGKSALVREIHRPLLERRGYFVSGKFDQTRRDVPCWAIVQALQELVRQILTERPERVARWKADMSQALGSNGQVIVELIPELELIIGPQANVEQLPSIESQNRFNTVFRSFVRGLARAERPLTIFLDDLQWADLASLELLKLLLTDLEIKGLFVIGAYRNNEVDDSHPLILTRSEIERARVECDEIELSPLSESSIAQLLTDALYCERDETYPLAELVAAKTDGNPFFVGEFLRSLYAEDLIRLDLSGRRWGWSLMRIRELDITENVVDFMMRRIRQLDAAARDMLKLCACLGNRFDMTTLALVADRPLSGAADALEPALREGLILAIDETYKYLPGYEDSDADISGKRGDLQVVCKFSHDRVQQAAYALFDPAERERSHYRIGERLLQQNPDGDETLIDIVSHLNAGRALAAGPRRRTLAELNLRAGLKARDSTAYDAALRNFRIGIELLNKAAWTDDYELIFRLHENQLEAAYLTGDEELMNRTEALLKERARSVTDLVKTYEIRMTYYTGKNQSTNAVATGLEYLRRLGLRLPERPGSVHIFWNFLRTRIAIGNRRIQDFVNLPRCEDPHMLAIQRMGTMGAPPAIIVGSNWLYILPMLTVRSSIAYGNSASSSFSYAIYGLNLCSRMRDFKRGFAFGQIGVEVAERLENRSLLAKTLPSHYYFIWHHRRHLRDASDRLLEAYRLSLESGDFEFVGWNTYFYTYIRFLIGHPLREMREIFARYIAVQQKHRHTSALNLMRPGAQFVENLLGESEEPRALEGRHFRESEMFADMATEHPSGAFHARLLKCLLHYLFEDYEAARRAAHSTGDFLSSVPAMPLEPLHYFYAALAAYACCEFEGGAWRRFRLRREARRYAKLIDYYAKHCPENYLHKKLLLDAEASRLRGGFEITIALYEEAARHARAQAFVQEAALIAERAGSFCFAAGVAGAGRSFIQQAVYDYDRWGAVEKLRQLREKYGEFPLVEAGEPEATMALAANRESGTTPTPTVDLQSLVDASQAISGEIVLNELIKKILLLGAAKSGATRACLVLYRSGEDRWILSAAYERLPAQDSEGAASVASGDTFTRWEDRGLEDGGAQVLAVSAVRRSIETRQALALDDATRSDEFRDDPYIERHRISSLLCLPLINQGQIAGVLYLEDSESRDAFNREQTRLITLLSTQMAISIENALSYENRQRVAELMELDRLKSELFANISHEFRTPLTLILSPIQDLLAANAGAQRDLLQLIQRSAHSMLRLVNNLLDLARAEAGGLQLNKKVVEIGAFVKHIAALFDSPATLRGLNLRCKIPGAALYARVDSILLERVLLNLVGNALKYTERGEIVVRLQTTGSDRFQITVSDSGQGIPRAILGRVFERFFSDESSWIPGTGIGLAFAREMVEAHDGVLSVKSREGAGSDFTVDLPCALFESAEGADAPPAQPEETAHISAANRYFREGLLIDLANDQEHPARSRHDNAASERILIVEDEADLRGYLASIFSNHYGVESAGDLPSAMEAVRRLRPDLVLCDVMLTNDRDGYEFLRAVRGDAALSDTLIVMLTARDDAQSRRSGLDFGADDYITKPFHTDEVVLRVRNLLNRRRKHERSLVQARDALYADLHERIGGSLEDLRERVQALNPDDSDTAVRERILKYLDRAGRSLVDGRQFREDLNLLGDDLLRGLGDILARRYAQSDRAIEFSAADDGVQKTLRNFRGRALTRLYTAIQEIATNDIKYGRGPATWRFETDDCHLRVFVDSETDYDRALRDRQTGGKGAGTIRSRLRELHGEYSDQTRDGRYAGRIEVPRDAPFRPMVTGDD